MQNCMELKKKTIETEIDIEGFGLVKLVQRPLTTLENTKAEAIKPNPLENPIIFKYIFEKSKIQRKIEELEELEEEPSKATKNKIEILYKEMFALEGKQEFSSFNRKHAEGFYNYTRFIIKSSLTNHPFFGGGIESENKIELDLLIDVLGSTVLKELQEKALSIVTLSNGERNEVK